MPQRGRQDIPNKIGAGGWDGRFTVEKPILKEGYVLASKFNQNEAQKLADTAWNASKSNAAVAATAQPPASREINHRRLPASAAREINHPIIIQHTNAAPAPAAARDQLDSNGSDFHARASHTTVLPTQWDGTFAKGGPVRVVQPSQHTNTNNFYGHSSEPTVLPAQWDGKFAPGSGAPYRPKPSQHTSTDNFYGYNTEPTVLPTQWDGKFAQGTEVRIKPETNRSDFRELYGVSSEPTVLPTQWDGKFAAATGPGSVYTVPERNESLTNDFYGYNTEPTVLPTQWSGKFELDPTDVRVRPERNESDVRDYADHRNFREVRN